MSTMAGNFISPDVLFTSFELEHRMKDIIFKRTELEDKEIMTKYFDEHPSRSCERTFVNVFLWSRQYPVKWAIVEGAMDVQK